MKKGLQLTILLWLTGLMTFGQSQPQWTRSITALPDSANMFPVKSVLDANGNIIVLSAYSSSTATLTKIVLNKFDYTGQLLWTTTFDNGGVGAPRGFDMVIDNNDNCYVAGGLMDNPYSPLLIRVNANGSIAWVVDSTSSQLISQFNQLFILNDKLYAGSPNGVAVFHTMGHEIWALGQSVSRMAVDGLGRVIIAGLLGSETLFRFDTLGNLDFSDSTIEARRICIDTHNNIILLTDYTQNYSYSLVKYDSSGIFSWQIDSFPQAPPFGDIGFDVVADYDNNLYVAGLSDTIFKFDPNGSLKWRQSMNGLDTYIISVKMIYNYLVIAGTIDSAGQNNSAVSIYNAMGWVNWAGSFNSNPQIEFSVDVVMDQYGVYVLEDSISNSLLMKFDNPLMGFPPVDYTLVCVDSVWYDPLDSTIINVTLFNGNLTHMNYPSVMIVSPVGDTISNRYNSVNFFAHGMNMLQTYVDTITVPGITDFSGYTFIISEGFGATSAVIQWCSTVSVAELDELDFEMYPNPASGFLKVVNPKMEGTRLTIFDLTGKLLIERRLQNGENMLDISFLSQGVYMVRVGDTAAKRLVKVSE